MIFKALRTVSIKSLFYFPASLNVIFEQITSSFFSLVLQVLTWRKLISVFQALFKGWCLKLFVNYQWSHLHSWVLGVTYVKWEERAIYYFPLYLPGSPRRCLGNLELMKVWDEPLHSGDLISHRPHEADFKLSESHLFCMAWENFPAFWVISQGTMEWEIALCKKVSPKSSRSSSPFPHIKGF